MSNSIENKSAALRTKLKQLRAAQNPTDTRRGALLMRGRLFTWLATSRAELAEAGKPVPKHIAAFWSLEQEPDLRPLLSQLVEEEGITVSLPVVTGDDAPLQFRLWTPDTPMVKGAFGIEEPQGPQAPAPDIILVPTLGFTRQGDRVGYGKGHYDRTLAALRDQGHRFVSLGIAWACGDLSGTDYQPAPHDFRLDAILTDKGWPVPAPKLLDRA
ncbi:5-formyltetrahydrofolate cyclo-ligase [Pusillimonas noertemannii]|uniref:5-formyltetrahydrofolate cyclo-ligase n=1 Tax=Pusillimonas noertemannii TaxID=305977 RepID=A0A2U1CPS8_9BURK|nr:5-formyltetrahydrofolate cyclo-ligase [Pusillimonas noertemannii]NYT67229.1 5-formyltetrahydrofolate cyclo-ligase [Pusillimonas noertemannii]PVY67902.1 5,10-methenyltetrahydrofolate synthetase [Pusillimonas noertemannii]TFL12576.1 5-formyltetrahydrofolate cyclo-ligase [Pusillimonas noertemannii]